jgi:hypothetical protein
MSWDPAHHDLLLTTRLHARVEIATDEIRTIESLPLSPRARAILHISKIDLECARTRLATHPDSLELDNLDRWIEMVESQLRTVRAVVTAIGPAAPPITKIA